MDGAEEHKAETSCDVLKQRMSRNCRDILIQSAVLVVITATAYLPATRSGYIWDDDRYVTNNPLLSASDGLYRIWFSKDCPSQYFPMTYTTFRLEYKLWKLNPTGYHITNILLHIVNAILLWWVLRYLSIPGAYIAAMIFALHPVQVESVVWISERKNLLMTFFFFLSLLGWTEFVYRTGNSRRAWPIYICSLSLYILSLLSKATACTLPAALVLILWLKRIPVNRSRWLQIFPYVFLGIAMGLLAIWWEKWHQGTGLINIVLSWPQRILIASHAVWFYIGKLILPVNLTFSYPKWNVDITEPLQYVWLVMCIISAVFMWRCRIKIGRGVITAMIFFVATLFPILGFISLFTFLYTYVADHYQYVACAGPIAFVSATVHYGIIRLQGYRKNILKAVIFLTLTVLWVLTWRQCRIYKTEETLWRDTVEKNPISWIANNNLGTVLGMQNKLDDALIYFYRALESEINRDFTYSNIGLIFATKGDLEQAIHYYNKSLEIKPDAMLTHYNLAMAMESSGRTDEAIRHYTEVVTLFPAMTAAHISLGSLLTEQGKFDEAMEHYRKAIQSEPENSDVHCYLGKVLELQGKIDEAVKEYDQALKIEPNSIKAKELLQAALRRQ